jgi:hypothetical protein
MSANYELELSYKVANTPVNIFPYAHFYVSNVFPRAFYSDLQKNLPDPQAMTSLAETGRVTPGAYKERFILPLNEEGLAKLPEDKRKFWHDTIAWLIHGHFGEVMMRKFGPIVHERFKNFPGAQFFYEGLLVNDVTNYSLGPHADAPRKVITMLFYLPADESQKHLGTSIYVPKDRSFTSDTGAHFKAQDFDLVTTMPFLPNSLFAFARTDSSFHGVEPVNDPNTRRWLLLFDIYARLPKDEKLVAAAPVGAKV